MGHDIFGEELHGAQDFLVVEAAHGEVGAEVLDAGALEFLDAGDAVVGVADDGAVLEYVVQGDGGFGSLATPFLDVVVDFAAAVLEPASPEEHIEDPFEVGGGVFYGLLVGLGDRTYNGRRGTSDAGLLVPASADFRTKRLSRSSAGAVSMTTAMQRLCPPDMQ